MQHALLAVEAGEVLDALEAGFDGDNLLVRQQGQLQSALAHSRHFVAVLRHQLGDGGVHGGGGHKVAPATIANTNHDSNKSRSNT